MSNARNLANLLESDGDIKVAALDNAPAPTKSTIDALGIAATSLTGSQATAITNNATTAGAALPKAGGALTGAVTTNSTFDGVDIATRDGVLTSTTATAAAALPKAGGTMTGVIAGFTSTGIDDNATSTAITIDASENVGIGVTPETDWHSGKEAIQLGVGASIYGDTTATGNQISANAKSTLGSTLNGYKYISTDKASTYHQYDGAHNFRVAASGSADAAISWNTAMTINNTGNVGIGVLPETSGSNYNVLQIGQGGSLMAPTATEDMYVGSNVYRNSSNTNSYIVTEKASIYEQYNGEHYFNVAPSGSADAAISFAVGMKISNAGIVTKPLQPAFMARAVGATNLSTGTWHTLAFGNERFDNNNDFSSNTFTAPATGKYQMNVFIRLHSIDNSGHYYFLTLDTSNNTYYHIHGANGWSNDPDYHTIGSSYVADMDAGDTATVSFYQASGSAQTDVQANEGYFSGCLVA